MVGLLLLAALIAVGTVWLLVRPVAFTASADTNEQYHQLIGVRERLLAQLHAIDTESTDRGIDAEIADDERRRVEAELAGVLRSLESLQTTPEVTGHTATRVRWPVIVAVGIVVPVVAFTLYVSTHFATLSSLVASVSTPSQQAGQPVPPMVLNMVARLEKRLAEQPHDAAGWARLGRSYQVLKRMADSRDAYAKAYQLAPDNVEILSEYASFLYEQNPQNTSGEVYELFARLHVSQPTHAGALWFLGLAAFQKAEYGTAVALWERLIDQIPADSPAVQQIRRAITEAQGRLGRQ